MNFLRDTAVLLGRTLKHVVRSPDTIITIAITPIALMLLFVYVLGGAIQANTNNYVSYLLPGILLIAIASGTSYTAFHIFTDMQKGIITRFNTMPISRSAVLWGHVLASLISNALSLVVIIAVAFVLGFRSSATPFDCLAVAGILLLFLSALTWLAVIPGLKAKTIDSVSAFAYPLIFLPFISSAFVPTDSMPTVVREFAERQPVTAIVDAIRSLFNAAPIGNDLWIALAWCLGLTVLAYCFAVRTYKNIL